MIYILGLFRKYITNNNAIHWSPRKYFDDMYSPEYAIEDLIEELKKLATQGKLPESVKTYLHEAWKEIEEIESCTDYGVPRRELPF